MQRHDAASDISVRALSCLIALRPGVRLGVRLVGLGARLGVGFVGLGVRLGVGFVGLGVRTNALGAADVALGTLGSSSTVDALAVGVASSGISVLAIAVGIAAVVVSVEESVFAYLLGTTSLAIRPESSFTWTSIALVAPAPALAGLLGCSVITKGHYKGEIYSTSRGQIFHFIIERKREEVELVQQIRPSSTNTTSNFFMFECLFLL